MHMQSIRKPLLTAGALLLGVLALFAALPLLLPFLLGYLAALGAEPGVRLLGRRSRLPRRFRSGICVSLLLGLAGLVLYLALRVLWAELVRLMRQLPDLLDRLEPTLAELRSWLTGLAARAPRGLAVPMIRWIDRIFVDGDLLLRSVYPFLSRLITRLITGLPGLLLGLITAIISAYMISASLPEVKTWLRTRLPKGWVTFLRTVRDRLHAALGGWLRAQLKLLLIMFLLLTLGLWLLGTEFPLLFGGIIACLDALPVLGTGTVLIPWALLAFLQNSQALGFGLLTLYGATALTRTALEPRLVGRQLGLHPLVTLMAFYAGYRLFGLPGMLLLPILAILTKQVLGNRPRPQPAANHRGPEEA